MGPLGGWALGVGLFAAGGFHRPLLRLYAASIIAGSRPLRLETFPSVIV